MIRIFGPEELGGAGDWRAKIEAEAARLGVTPESIGEKVISDFSAYHSRRSEPCFDVSS